jgi:hypothetical protein
VIRVGLTSTTADEAVLHISVKDTGIGIPLNKQQHVFSAFAQADSSSTRTFGGTGLGLSISTQLVRPMGGDISPESEEGVGSIFHFSIRLGIASGREEGARPCLQIGALGAALENAGVDSQARLRFLVVEDNAVNRMVATRILEKRNHAVRVAVNGSEALQMIEEEEFDCVLMDIQMPCMD